MTFKKKINVVAALQNLSGASYFLTRQLVADGYAECEMRDNGEIEVRFTSGEVYLLSKATILRLS